MPPVAIAIIAVFATDFATLLATESCSQLQFTVVLLDLVFDVSFLSSLQKTPLDSTLT